MLHVVTGPPAAGKTTFVAERAQPGDIRIDLDHLANLFAGMPADNHEHTGTAMSVARVARDAAVSAAIRKSDLVNVWIIDSSPGRKRRTEYVAADARFHTVDPGRDVVMSRIKAHRSSRMHAVAARWYDSAEQSSVTVTSHAAKRRVRADVHLDATVVPNPHDVPRFRPCTGRNAEVRAWIMGHAEAHDLVDAGVQAVRDGAGTLAVRCSAGRHRSVAVAEAIAERLEEDAISVTVDHRELDEPKAKTRRRSTAERGYGHRHRKQREYLLKTMTEGQTCWWCGEPMFSHQDLDADHSKPALKARGALADRLLHSPCNRSRKDGQNDDQRPALTTQQADQQPATPAAPAAPVFSWPTI